MPTGGPQHALLADGEQQPGARAREAHVEEPAFLLQIVECGVAIVRDKALLDARDHAGVEFQPLGAVQRESDDLAERVA